MRRTNDNRRSGGVSPMVVSILAQAYSAMERSGYKPPVTIALLALNVLIHISPTPNILGFDLTNIGQNCIDPHLIVTSLLYHPRQLLVNRLILSGFMHADDMHLYYNMISLTWKGINLEKHMGSRSYLKLVVYSLLASHVLLVVLATALYQLGVDNQYSGFYTCAVGFSAVLFSLKYIWNETAPGLTSIFGVWQVHTKYAAWLELVLISVMTPNASFLGHLAGILAGMSYFHFLRWKTFMH